EGVVVGLADNRVPLGAADQHVVAAAPGERARAGAGLQPVVAVATGDRRHRAEHVVALARRTVVGNPVEADRDTVGVVLVGHGGAGAPGELRVDAARVDLVVPVPERRVEAVEAPAAEAAATGVGGPAGAREGRAVIPDQDPARQLLHRDRVLLSGCA